MFSLIRAVVTFKMSNNFCLRFYMGKKNCCPNHMHYVPMKLLAWEEGATELGITAL
jgi:hypothetical protein